MSYIKRRLAVFLSVLVAFTTIFVVIPTESVQAATLDVYWIGNPKEVQVQKGARDVYVGDYAYAYSYTPGKDSKEYGYLSMNSGVTYSSSNKSVAKVDSKTGKLTTKKNGTTTITIKFKGKTVKTKVKVVSSLSSARTKVANLEKQEAAAKKFVKAYGKGKITTKNRYELLSLYAKCRESGYCGGTYTEYKNGGAYASIVSPICGRSNAMRNAFYEYAQKQTPFSTRSSKCLKVKSVSGSGKKVTLNLTSKITADQMFGASADKVSWEGKYSGNKNKIECRFSVYDDKYQTIYGTGVIKKGSNKIVITLEKSLTKGKKYTVDGYSDWLYHTKNKFKAK